jgi:hypothetical protein
MTNKNYNSSVFINCPFDSQYKSLFDAIIFTLIDCGFNPRCTLEINDSSQVRISSIGKLISECRYCINDISRTELDENNNLPRFNMPLELGLSLGAKIFGNKEQKRKNNLILDKEDYRYQKFCSDISGQDISSHYNSVEKVIKVIRNWLQTNQSRNFILPGGKLLLERYSTFLDDLPDLSNKLNLELDELTFKDYKFLAQKWLKINKKYKPKKQCL